MRESLPVVVHLKNTSGEGILSNANLIEWYKFFKACQKFKGIKFILIGNEKIGTRIEKLPNIIVTNQKRSDISKDLGFIQTAYFFMGMASGPCIMAIFNDVPYVIFKDPNQHSKDMQKELGTKDYFSFAKGPQKILRTKHTSSILMSEFLHLLHSTNRVEWQKRISKKFNE